MVKRKYRYEHEGMIIFSGDSEVKEAYEIKECGK